MTGPLFDSYLIVDWSAAGIPKRGPDSVWLRLESRAGSLLENPATRAEARARILTLVLEALQQGQRILVGLDFGFGYPVGFAEALGLAGSPWRAVWNELCRRIDDRATNSNNRFQAAAEINQRLTGGRGPFWGCPRSAENEFLGCRRNDASLAGLAERRLCEQRLRRSHPVWKLYTTGSVGSQTLLGIPRLASLLSDPRLAGRAAVWPFETGLTAPYSPGAIFAEIYPSMRIAEARPGEVKDSAQVRTLARWFRELGQKERLSELFEGPADLTPDERRQVESEEGWILGVL
ncbi:MAG: cobalamin biosynthesis protein CbiG [Acidobacteria bacterium]|nr:cobalamin biosynthesis protein CbiG [Acidobacteriota bacterium]